MNKPKALVTIAIGRNGGNRWDEENFETSLEYDECKDEALLLAEASQVLDLGDDVAFIHMTNYEVIEEEDEIDADLPLFDLVEIAHGPHKGEVHRSEQMTQRECDRRNAGMEVIQWQKRP